MTAWCGFSSSSLRRPEDSLNANLCTTARVRGLASIAHAVDVNGELTRAAQCGALSVRGRILHEPRVLEPSRELGKRNLRLQPRHGRAVTVMDATAEAEVLVILAIGVEPLGVAEAGRVPVPRSEQQDHGRAARDCGGGNGDVGEGCAR